jgi:hypothetical protein
MEIYVPPKRSLPPTRLHGFTTQKNTILIFTAVKNSDLITAYSLPAPTCWLLRSSTIGFKTPRDTAKPVGVTGSYYCKQSRWTVGIQDRLTALR